ncbi:hypothetical protein UA18_03445 [Burkholderia multivorans]|uniref:Phage stabilisation protein n=2 Tax=Burkholderia cepacia complex TaxID=87882 RepID=A4JD34_BURVG|nr:MULTISPECIES: hypothetical protein [Burkholderia cepacia complex]ABO54187.1 hypothetical protein Bcep1808_1176 [Burkholderia vietnamiensis G4]MCB4347319.1 hypothetical protein [Burkholderia vietnamiensis]SAJ96535.1 hypothetical protein UA18_03445 [Burkholderia multivorans]
MKVPLITGAYTAKSLVAEAQRCINLYAEKNPQDASFPFTYYPTPGLTLKATAPERGWRGLYFASNGVGYGVCGSTVYRINSDFTLKSLGSIATASGPVSMVDNATYLVIVDGTSTGYTVKLTGDTFAPISDGGFAGGNTVNFSDGFLILNSPGTREWYISLNDEISFDATDFASKSGFSDKLVGVGVTKRYVYLLGEVTTEVWFNAGDSTFPYERLPGVFMQHGCAAAGSIAHMDGEVYWLAQSQQGVCYVNRSQKFNATQISTFALDNEIASYPRVDDAIGFTYQIEGHFFYVLTFPSADKTWQYDLSTEQWNELSWVDENGGLRRHRANCYASLYGQPIVGDWENGNLYLWDVNAYTDNGNPIPRIRSFMHSVDDNSDRMRYREFIANMEVGNGSNNSPVWVFLRWSDTRGKSWGNAIKTSLGKEGEYATSLQFQRLGMARDRVFELSWSAPVKTSLLGAWVQAESNNQ